MRLIDINLADIGFHERNVRHDVGDVTELANSIKEQGLLQPVVVAPDRYTDGTGQPYVLIAGHRRIAAAEKAGLDNVPAIVRSDLDTDEKVIEAMLVENLQRSDLTPMEEAGGYEQLTLAGYDVQRISTATGRSETTVRQRLALTKLPEPIQDRVHERQLTLAQADRLADLANEPDALERVARDGFTDWAIADAERRRDNRARFAEKLKATEDAGVEIFDEMPAGGEYIWDLMARGLVARDSDHAEQCDHHAVILEQNSYGNGRLDPICVDPSTHGAIAVDPEESDDEATEREARAERERVFTEQVETAGRVRGDWVRTWIRAQKMSAGQVASIMAATVRNATDGYMDCNPPHIADWLGIDRLDAGSYEDAQTAVTDWLASAAMTPTHHKSPAKALVAVLAADYENTLARPYTWRHLNLADLIPWFDLLETLGYELSDFEREHLAEASAAAAADAEDGGDG